MVIRTLFVTQDGRLNFVWRLVIYQASLPVILVLCAVPATLLVRSLAWSSPLKNALGAVFLIPAVLGWTYLFRRKVDRLPWRGVGLTGVGSSRLLLQLAGGFVLAWLMAGLVFLVEYMLGWVQPVGSGLKGKAVLGVIGLVLLGLVANAGAGFAEEVAYRGYVFQNLAHLRLWLSIGLSSLLFTLVVHANTLTLSFAAVSTVFGILLVLLRLSTQTIWCSVGLHWGWNWTLTYLLGLSGSSHSLLQLRHREPVLAGFSGQELVVIVTLGAGSALMLAWLKVTKGLTGNARLDEEGRLRS